MSGSGVHSQNKSTAQHHLSSVLRFLRHNIDQIDEAATICWLHQEGRFKHMSYDTQRCTV